MAPTAFVRRALQRAAVPFAVIGLTITTLAVTSGGTAVADDYPGEDQIAAARAAVADAASSVTALDAAIAGLEEALNDADVAAASAEEDYLGAQQEAEAANEERDAAQARADEAEAALALARRGLAGAAMQSYKNAGSMGSLEAITQTDGFDEVIQRTEAINKASSQADITVQEVSAAELVAATTREYAEEAADKAAQAQQAAQDSLSAAKTARDQAAQAVSVVASARNAAIARVAQLRGVSQELEQERQNGLAAERQARAEAEARDRIERENSSQTSNVTGGNGSSSGSSNGSSGSSSGSTSTSTPKPTTSSTPKPTTTSAPEPTKTSEPEPEPTKTSAPEPEPDTSWSSSAAQGRTAASHALSLKGHPYSQTLDGGTGPTYYDCSGLVQEAWAAAGKYIPRTSRSQYAATTHLPYSQLRPGDLVFLSRNGTTSGIYHVAMYIGNGQVMEARKPGVLSQTRSLYAWGVSDMMPYIGRP